MDIIKFENIIKNYGKIKALDNLTFSIGEGSCTALIGNNGCGKTTTMYVIGNIISYDSGQYLFKNILIMPKNVSYKNKLGMILSESYYVEEFDIISYWKFVAKFQKIPKEEIDKRVADLLELLELESEKGRKIKKLSSGNQMKVTFGSAIIHNPELLILDEPFINLDIKTIKKLTDLLITLKPRKTIFITSHNLDLVANLCDNFLIMDSGKIIKEFRKTDFTTVEVLKSEVTKILSGEKEKQEIFWLK